MPFVTCQCTVLCNAHVQTLHFLSLKINVQYIVVIFVHVHVDTVIISIVSLICILVFLFQVFRDNSRIAMHGV